MYAFIWCNKNLLKIKLAVILVWFCWCAFSYFMKICTFTPLKQVNWNAHSIEETYEHQIYFHWIYAAMSNILMCIAVINAAFYSDLVYLYSSLSEYERKNPIINNGIEYKLSNPYLFKIGILSLYYPIFSPYW